MKKDQYIVALEIGSSKILGAVATKNPMGAVTVVALEEEKVVDCVRYGIPQNIEEIYTRVQRILRKLENRTSLSPGKIKSIYVGVAGRSIRAIRQNVETNLPEDTTISDELIRHLKNDIKRDRFDGFEILAIDSYKYTVDGIETKKPVGMYGSHLISEFNLIVGRPIIKNNLRRLIEDRLQLDVKGYFITALDTAQMVLTPEESQLGCMLVDFGAETTTVSIYKNGVIEYLSTIPLGSRNITRDITTLNILEDRAEEVKKSIGNAILESSRADLMIDNISSTEAANYIAARAGEIVANIVAQLDYAKLTPADIPGGIILIGGGSKLKGLDDLLNQHTKLKVRKGTASPEVNILDQRVQGLEYVNMVSLLQGGAYRIKPGDNCVEFPPQPAYDHHPHHEGEGKGRAKGKAPQETHEEPKKHSRLKSMIENFKKRTAGMFDDDENDDNDEEK